MFSENENQEVDLNLELGDNMKIQEKELDTGFQFSSSQLKDLIKSVVDGLNETKDQKIEENKTKTKKKAKKSNSKTEKKFSADVPSFLLKFSEKGEAKLINNFRTQAIAREENPNKLLKSLILNTLTSENTLKSYSALKNDIYYSLRKAVYTSLSPFYLRLEENNIEIEHKFELINFKLNLIINLLLENMQKSQFEIEQNKMEDLVMFKSLKQKQEQEYILLKKKNQARKKEIYQSYHNYLLSEQIESIINDDNQLVTKPNSKKAKSILEYLTKNNKEDENKEQIKNEEEKQEKN